MSSIIRVIPDSPFSWLPPRCSIEFRKDNRGLHGAGTRAEEGGGGGGDNIHLRREHAGRGRGHGESCRSDGSAGGKRPEATWLRRSEGERSGSSALGAAGSLVKWGVGSGEVVQSQSRSRAKAV